MAAPQLTVSRQGQSSVSADLLNSFAQTCDTITQLRSFVGIQGVQVYVRGQSSPDDGGAGNFWWDATGNAPDDGTNIIVPPAAGMGEWVRINEDQPYDIAVNFQGKPSASQVFRYSASRGIGFAADFGLVRYGYSQSSADVAATAQAIFTIGKAFFAAPNTFTTIGTITYPAGSAIGFIASVNHIAYTIAPGDVLHITCPAVPDATLAGIAITIAGVRVG